MRERIPYDPSHQYGWDYTSDAHTLVSFYGAACDIIVASWEYVVQILYACP